MWCMESFEGDIGAGVDECLVPVRVVELGEELVGEGEVGVCFDCVVCDGIS